MGRPESDRRIESALTIFVVAVALGLFAELGGRVGSALSWWQMRERGSSYAQMGVFNWLWSWAPALRVAASWGIVIALWRCTRSLLGGRARTLASASLWTFIAAQVVAAAWQVWWPVGGRAYTSSENLQLIFGVMAAVNLGLHLVGWGLCVAVLVALAHATPAGARGAWGSRALVAWLAIAGNGAWLLFGYAWTVMHPGLGLVVNAAVTGLQGLAILALLLPVRRAWREAIVTPLSGTDGPYRQAAPAEGAWRTASELRLAGDGIAEVARRVRQLTVVTLLEVVLFFIILPLSYGVWLGALALVAGALQLGLSILLARGLARYTCAPHELPGRSLGVGALICTVGAVVTSAKSLLGLSAAFLGLEGGMAVMASDGLGGAVAGCLATILLFWSLARAARGLGDLEVPRRARIVAVTYVVTLALAVLTFHLLLESRSTSIPDTVPIFALGVIVVALIFMGVYVWLLKAATRMLSFAPQG